jgi:peptide/nickel transport system permease protein
LITRHMFPNVLAPMLVSVTLGVGESILFEAALSFLGLGVQPPTPSWGNMLFNAQELIYQAPFLAILPGLLILFVTISFNYLGDGLQDAIDPKAMRR